MSIHIHLYGCNCIFCDSDFPIDFFQSFNENGLQTQSSTSSQDDEFDDDEEDEPEEDEPEEDEPKPNKTNKIFGFLIGKHDVCVL